MDKNQNSLSAEQIATVGNSIRTLQSLAHEYYMFLLDPIGRKPHFIGAVDAHARATTALNAALVSNKKDPGKPTA